MIALLALVLAASGPVRLAAPGLNAHGVDAALVDGWLDRFVSQLSRSGGMAVTTRRDIEQLIGLERQRQLLGCAEGSCTAELVGALGVDAILAGSVLKSESGYTVTLRVLRSGDGRELATATGRFAREAELLDWLDATAPTLAQQTQAALGRQSPSAARSALAWKLTAGAGGAVTVAAIAQLIAVQLLASRLKQPGFSSVDEINHVANDGMNLQISGYVCLGVGVAVLGAGLLWGLLGGGDTKVALVPTGNGFALAGVWP